MDTIKTIDFVIPWVDGGDKKWLLEKASFSKTDENDDSRYRDWGFFKYWFRSVEKNAPWVNKIFLIVDNQLPDFLDISNKKLVIVNHSDFIPKKYLPTFSSHVIELNIHRIKGLSERFVYFNDDTFLNRSISSRFFFKKGFPRYVYIERKTKKEDSFMGSICSNNIRTVNKMLNRTINFSYLSKVINIHYGKYLIKNIPLLFKKSFQSFEDDHMPTPFLKSTICEMWKNQCDVFDLTSNNKFRMPNDINQYIFRYYDLARGKFYPKWVKHGGYYLLSTEIVGSLVCDILKGRNMMICLNDNSGLGNQEFEYLKTLIMDSFEKRYPKKSSFEK